MVGPEQVRGAVRVTRPTNALAAGVLTFIGTFVAGEPIGTPAAVAVVATVIATGAGMAINDYVDREIDAINRPERPIPSGDISPRWALWESLILFGIAIALALTLPIVAIAIAVVNLIALLTYTSVFKGLPGVGNAVVALLAGSTFLFGGAAVGGIEETFVLFLLAALSTLGREIIKDVEDVDGDRVEGLMTLPIAIGERRSLYVASGCLMVAATASPVPYLAGLFGVGYLLLVIPAIAVMLAGALASLRDPSRGQRFVKVGMYVAILAFVIGRMELQFV